MSKSLRIGITCYPTYGGSGVIATEIGKAMAKRGHRVHFISSDVPRRLMGFTENIYYHEVETEDYPLFDHQPYTLSLASKMVEVSTYEKLDLLHVHYAIPHATSAYLAKQILGDKAPKLITTLHGTDITLVGTARGYLPITRFSIEQSDAVTVPSGYLKNATYDKLNVSSDLPIEVIPNFVDTDLYKPSKADVRGKYSQLLGFCAKGDKVLTHVSNFRAVKRIEDVIRIFAEVNKVTPAHLMLGGDGPERSKAENLVRDLGLQERVCFLGKQESVVEILQSSDLFLLPSEHESFGLAALEAMSCEVPVIASRAGGIPEVVIDGECGFLSDVGDVDSMAKNALKLLQDPALLQRFGTNARRRVIENFGIEDVITRYENYYLKIL